MHTGLVPCYNSATINYIAKLSTTSAPHLLKTEQQHQMCTLLCPKKVDH